MSVLLSLLIAGAGAFFFFAKRRFDFFSVAYLSAAVYFLPGVFGYVLLPRTGRYPTRDRAPIGEETYWVMIAVVVAIWLAAVLADQLRIDRLAVTTRLAGSRAVPVIALLLALAGMVLTIREGGAVLLSADKGEVLTQVGRWRLLTINAAMFGTVAAFLGRQKMLTAALAAFLVFDLYIGFRFPLAMSVIACLTCHLAAYGRQRFAIEHWRLGVLGTAVAGFFFVYKGIYQLVKLSLWDSVVERLTDPERYVSAVTEFEAFTTQAILDRTIREDWHVGMGHFGTLRQSFLPVASADGLTPASFGQLSRDRLFPDALGGIASNIWAEMWSSGGWLLLIVALIILMAWLGALSAGLGFREPAAAATVALLGSLWAFYLHRNDLQFQVTLSKRALVIAALCAALGLIWGAVSRSGVSKIIDLRAKRGTTS